jgi:hypothetical protein
MGVPSISCGDNPHASFDSFHLASSQEQYRDMLRNFQNLPRNQERMKHQACAFYYMHNLNITPDALEMRRRLHELYRFFIDLEGKNPSFDGEELGRLLRNMEEATAFRAFVGQFAALLPL